MVQSGACASMGSAPVYESPTAAILTRARQPHIFLVLSFINRSSSTIVFNQQHRWVPYIAPTPCEKNYPIFHSLISPAAIPPRRNHTPIDSIHPYAYRSFVSAKSSTNQQSYTFPQCSAGVSPKAASFTKPFPEIMIYCSKKRGC